MSSSKICVRHNLRFAVFSLESRLNPLLHHQRCWLACWRMSHCERWLTFRTVLLGISSSHISVMFDLSWCSRDLSKSFRRTCKGRSVDYPLVIFDKITLDVFGLGSNPNNNRSANLILRASKYTFACVYMYNALKTISNAAERVAMPCGTHIQGSSNVLNVFYICFLSTIG